MICNKCFSGGAVFFYFFSNYLKRDDYRITSKLKLNRFCLGFLPDKKIGAPKQAMVVVL